MVSVLLFTANVANATHYEDPFDGGKSTSAKCGSDEQPIKIQGIDGVFCSPACASSSGSCPTDVPSGVTAKPQCALHDQQGDKFCALICDPSESDPVESENSNTNTNTCGAHASCKAISGTGLCTYDDGPKPPSSEHWVPIDSPTFTEMSMAIAVGFLPDGQTGWVGGGANGVGAQIKKSVDGGKTWTAVYPTNASQPAFNIFLATAAAKENSAAVSGALYQTYTTDGDHFEASTNGVLSPAQDASVLPGGSLALVGGPFGGANGVATSMDGKVWTGFDIGLNATIFLARYGAFPSDTTWYVTAGNFPSSNSKEKGTHHLTHRMKVNANQKVEFDVDEKDNEGDGPVACTEDPENCFSAAIAKTTDGGKTWTKVWSNTKDNIYPNGIHCSSESHCVAVVEGDTCRILLTRDGGKTWTESMHDTDSKCSLVSARMLNEKEGWISGGYMSQLDFEGRYWHTLDGGSNFSKEAIKGLYVMSFDMTSEKSGFSVALTQASGVALLKYRQSNHTLVSL
jgi:photosystem II stability/assembly factor-like uncharacterized protein